MPTSVAVGVLFDAAPAEIVVAASALTDTTRVTASATQRDRFIFPPWKDEPGWTTRYLTGRQVSVGSIERLLPPDKTPPTTKKGAAAGAEAPFRVTVTGPVPGRCG
jgi:hypothetical protein